MDSDVCARLRAARKAAGLSQFQVAEMLGISGAAYSGYESGRREPSFAQVIQMANALGVSLSALAAPDSETAEEQLLAAVRKRPDLYPAIQRLLDTVPTEAKSEDEKLIADVRKRPDLQPVVRRLLDASPSAAESADRLLILLK